MMMAAGGLVVIARRGFSAILSRVSAKRSVKLPAKAVNVEMMAVVALAGRVRES